MSRTSDYERGVTLASNTFFNWLDATQSKMFALRPSDEEWELWTDIYCAIQNAELELQYWHLVGGAGHAR